MISLSRPTLPCEDKISSYLKRIDDNHYYSNFGALEGEYRSRLSQLFGAPVVTTSSATSALTATLMALDLPKGSLVAMPSFTFPATASAVVSAGHVPFFMDVMENQWSINIHNYPDVKAIIVVSPFGNPLKVNYWDEFVDVFNIPVIIDAAAGFDSFSTLCKPGKCPVVVSTHATKSFGTGEGGFVTCHDNDLLEKIRRITNFGITPDRRIEYTGLNAKFSEYHAAVGLAELDGWEEKRKKWIQVKKWYVEDVWWNDTMEWANSSQIWKLHIPAEEAVEKLKLWDIESSLVRYGCHIHNAYKDCPRTDLGVTDFLLRHVIMLPCFMDMTQDQVMEVRQAMKETLCESL